MPHPVPWYIAGLLIGLMVPALLLIGNKPFGISSNFRHLCAAVAPCGIEFFSHDWKHRGLWNLTFLAGVCAGAAIAAWLAPPPPIHLSPRVLTDLQAAGVHDVTGLVPREIFSWSGLLTLRGLVAIVLGSNASASEGQTANR
jgi:hypothetical protein